MKPILIYDKVSRESAQIILLVEKCLATETHTIITARKVEKQYEQTDDFFRY